jgi:hypothetical protein
MSTFTTAQAQGARYHLETLIYTGWPFAGTGGASSLPSGQTQIANASSWNVEGKPAWRADLDMIQATQSPNVHLTWSADPGNQINFGVQTGTTQAARAGVRQMTDVRISAVDTLSASLDNTTSSAISGWQTNYSVTMRRLTAVDKILARRDGLVSPWYQLTPDEQEALRNLGITNARGQVTTSGQQRVDELVAKGTLPLSRRRIVDGLYRNRMYEEPPDLWYPLATSVDNPFAQYRAAMTDATRGRFLVLHTLAVEGAPDVTVTVDRDGQAAYMSVAGSAFAQSDDEAWHPWIPATDYLNFHVILGPGGTQGNVAIRIGVAAVSMSQYLAVLFGRVQSRTQLSRPTIYDQAVAGLM